MIANPAQAQQAFEYAESRVVDVFILNQLEQERAVVVTLLVIELALRRLHVADQLPLRARRQVLRDLLLRAPQDEGIDQLVRELRGLLVALALDGRTKLLTEVFGVAEQPRIKESELRCSEEIGSTFVASLTST